MFLHDLQLLKDRVKLNSLRSFVKMKLECWSFVTCKYFCGEKILDAKTGGY